MCTSNTSIVRADSHANEGLLAASRETCREPVIAPGLHAHPNVTGSHLLSALVLGHRTGAVFEGYLRSFEETAPEPEARGSRNHSPDYCRVLLSTMLSPACREARTLTMALKGLGALP